jgi:2,3-bisphosphoglycerate-independent phosphoglycerate mutase
MVAAGWQHHIRGEGEYFPDAMTALETLRGREPGIGDQDLPGFVIAEAGKPVGTVEDGDSVLCFNFRGDRAIELSRAFDEGDTFSGFDRGRVPDVFYAGMMQYDGDLPSPNHYLVGPPNISNTLSAYLIEHCISQYAISETQKYGHVTYFWNGNRSGRQAPELETFVEVPSDNVPFDQRPWMKAAEITDQLIAAIQSGEHRFLRVNYPNGDMVGHTGNLQAAITAMSCLDLVLYRLLRAVDNAGGIAIVTADHGNCDEMFQFKNDHVRKDSKGNPLVKTSHTLSPVPFILFDPESLVPGKLNDDPNAGIANVAATTAQLLGLEVPKVWEPGLLAWGT